MPLSWLQISATTDRPQLAEAVFEQYGAEAITELDAGGDLVAEETPGSLPPLAQAHVIGLFSQSTRPDPIKTALTEALGPNTKVAAQILENQDWASAWLAEHPPLAFGQRLWVAPHNAQVDVAEDAVVVRLDPGLAFGTGTHPTTRLCLQWLAEQDLTGRRVLDYGCGSGILAIAAAKLGAVRVTAVDIDEQAIRATRENAKRNHVADNITVSLTQDCDSGPYDIILANILARPLIDLAPTLARLAAPGAPLILAGLLSRQINEVVSAYDDRFEFEGPAIEQDWARLTGRRTGEAPDTGDAAKPPA